MSTIVCPLCDANIPSGDYVKVHMSPLSNQEYKLYHCRSCHIEFWAPMKIIPEFYENDAFKGYFEFHEGHRDWALHFTPFFKHFPLRGGTLLDIGCADGVFIKEAQKLGFEVWGIDLDKLSIKVAQEKHGLKNTFVMTLDEFVEFSNKENLRFDVVTFFEVLEHQDNIKGFMGSIANLLKHNGMIAGTVPNRERYFVEFSRKQSAVDDPPHHFTYWSKDILRFLFEKNDFGNIEFYLQNCYSSLGEISAVWENKLFGGISKHLKLLLKKGVGLEGKELHVGLERFVKSRDKRVNIKILSLFKRFRNFAFLPIALLTQEKFNERGFWIYFHAERLKN